MVDNFVGRSEPSLLILRAMRDVIVDDEIVAGRVAA
jgi:hypothetical protein